MIRLKEILEKRGLTQVWLSDQIGVSVVSVNNWCQNKNDPSLKTLKKMAVVLGIKIADLIIEENIKQ
ncbi:MAG: helix-turn-helix transcriptional regulator [Leadbetterella sp.]|nr:helix-turn-helix transcriptional regulator [Leadbetterella sp.]